MSPSKELMLSEHELALATDFYELTMAAAYFNADQLDRQAVFEAFVRKLPRNRSYMVAAGLEQVLEYIRNLTFTEDQISYLQSLDTFKHVPGEFFDYLRRFRFTGDLWAVDEGTVLFPNEPFIRVEAPIIEAQILETYLLSVMNFESLIATKASRIVNAAGGRDVVEFGFRRAHGPHAALLAARASFVGGCVGTSNTLAAYKLGIPAFGTMAHSFVMNFENELDAFTEFNKVFSHGFLLVDTYDTIEAVKKIVQAKIPAAGIRLDSGDLHFLSVECRRILDAAGYTDSKIMASGDLNEYIIRDLVDRGAPIDVFGVGTELVTSRDDPALNGVYKLTAIKVPAAEGKYRVQHRIKTSPGKKTHPGPKQVFRIVENSMLKTDIVGFEDEPTPENSTPLLKKYMEGGRVVRQLPSLKEIQQLHQEQIMMLPCEFTDLGVTVNIFPVRFSDRLEAAIQQFKV
jgi:nicotinate phosphoribosyltransferase